jgi:peptidoglycan/LPS O-acetylase OafA/YrhL
MKLLNFTQSRDNNFNLIRILAALAVLITHSFALAIGSGDAEPFRENLGMTMGSIAVDIFFITSGFLVTASLLTRQSAIEFIWARVLRIFPALLVMLLLTVFGLGVFFTSLPLPSYLADPKIYIYLVKCSTLITGVAYNLPGVFDGNPYKNAVNGSLWTMPYEIRMYAILAIVWVALRITKRIRFRTFELIILTSAVAAGVFVIARHLLPSYFPTEGYFANLFFMFFSGAAFYVLKEHITLSRLFFWLFVIALLTAAIANKHSFFVVYTLTIAYVLFYLAYVPSGLVRKYNQVGDYSYGVYIYAFPVQQSVAALIPGVSVLLMVLISAVVTLLLAVFSWHFLERRALGLKGLYVGHTRRILTYGQTGKATRTL